MTDWSKYCKHPSTVLILGDVLSGKTATAASILQYYHECDIECYILSKYSGYPKWVHSLKQAEQLPINSALLLDDAHKDAYARDWVTGGAKSLDMMGRQRAHGNRSIIYTTQQSRVLDINLVSMANCIVFKRPSLLQLQVERRELKKIFEEADKELEKKNYGIEWAYVIAGRKKGLVKVDMPKWYARSISDEDEDEEAAIAPEQSKGHKAFKIVHGIISGIGRL